MLRYSPNFLMLMRNLRCCESKNSKPLGVTGTMDSLQVGWNTETYQR